MNTLYCWFDWDDNTTTVNSINIIKEPRKPLREYKKGDKVLAKLPQFGMWNGIIVEISESKKELVQKMTTRQKLAAACIESDGNVETVIKDNEAKKDLGQKVTAKQTSAGAGLESDSDCTVQAEMKVSGKKKEKPHSSKRSLNEEEKVKAEVKKKKKEDEAVRLEAKNKQLQSIILERRAEKKGQEEMDSDSVGETLTSTNILPLGSENILPLDSGIEYSQQQLNQDSSFHDSSYQGMTYSSGTYHGAENWPGSQFGSHFSNFQRYTYVGDIMSPSSTNSTTFHEFESQRELQDKCVRLQLENEQLKKENEELRLQLERSRESNDCQTDDVLTPRKVDCLRQIVSAFEEKSRSIPAEKPKVYKPKPVRLAFSEEVGNICTPKRPTSEGSHWEECVTSSGMKKVRLVPELEVYLTQGQLSQVKHSGSENPRKMTVALLDVLFTREQLAQSSAKGSRKAHNASIKTYPLPDVTVQAIKQFVLNSFKKDTGEPCLTDPVFNDIINSKCATARRSLKH